VDLVLIGLGLGLDRVGNHRQELFGRLVDNRLGSVAERVAGNGLLQLGDGDDITGHGLLDGMLFLAFQFVDLADTFLDPFGGIEDRGV